MDEVRKTGGGGGVKGSVRRLHRTALHSSPLPLSRDPWGGAAPGSHQTWDALASRAAIIHPSRHPSQSGRGSRTSTEARNSQLVGASSS
jgi:hypothetical protein